MERRPNGDAGPKVEDYVLNLADPLPQHQWPELFFGIVAPIGTPRDGIKRDLARFLHEVGYTTYEVRLSRLLEVARGWEPKSRKMKETWDSDPHNQPFYEARTGGLMDLGNEVRKMTATHGAMAVIAAYAIHISRERVFAQEGGADKSGHCVAYILDQLKRPEEVYALQEIYGQRFHLIGCSAPESDRIKHLADKVANSHNQKRGDLWRAEAYGLATRDFSEEGEAFGQNVRATYPLADVFVSIEPNRDREVAWQIERYVQLIFGNYRWTPVRDEHGMHLAHAAALNSADLARQVGAAICTPDGSCISVGWNEVPKAGGGMYWASVLDREPDARDVRGNKDPMDESRIRVLTEIIRELKSKDWLNPGVAKNLSEGAIVKSLVRPNLDKQSEITRLMENYFKERATEKERKEALKEIENFWGLNSTPGHDEATKNEFLEYLLEAEKTGKGSGYLHYLIRNLLSPILSDAEVMSINEFGRTVHAELTAITDAARRGVSLEGSTLFTTTFPCHECARHILAAGISRVVYVQPYPKSYAKESHGDSIQVDDLTVYTFQRKVRFEPFVGVGPRRYLELFQYTRKVFNRKTTDGMVAKWVPRKPRYTEPPIVYKWRERKSGQSLMENSGYELSIDDPDLFIHEVSK